MDWSKPFSHVEDPTCWQIGQNKFWRAHSKRATRQSIPRTEKLDLVCQHASKDLGAATAGRVANEERPRIERPKVIQSGQVLAARQVGGRETNQPSQRNCQTSRDATRGRLCQLCHYVDLSLTREGWIRSKRRWSNFGATEGWPRTRKRNRSNDLD
jgi:hypothetical protein